MHDTHPPCAQFALAAIVMNSVIPLVALGEAPLRRYALPRSSRSSVAAIVSQSCKKRS